VPHMGWNRIQKRGNPDILDGIEDGAWFYFVHSYYVVPDKERDVATVTTYGASFVSSVAKGALFACQFHPEKSSAAGLRLLKNFTRMVERKGT